MFFWFCTRPPVSFSQPMVTPFRESPLLTKQRPNVGTAKSTISADPCSILLLMKDRESLKSNMSSVTLWCESFHRLTIVFVPLQLNGGSNGTRRQGVWSWVDGDWYQFGEVLSATLMGLAEPCSSAKITCLIDSFDRTLVAVPQLPWPTLIASLSTTSSSFNSLFRVLLIFPSWYLSAIGLLQSI